MAAMTALHDHPLFGRLETAERILVAGAGGGFDVYSGLPIALSLLAQGRQVHLANLTFSSIGGLPAESWLAENVARVGPDSAPHQWYFPERTLACWLDRHDFPSTVLAFERTGVQPLRAAYRAVIEEYGIDTVILVDGGTDILMRGDEAGLGTPEEDMASVAALAGIDTIDRLVVSVGFGVDAYHGVSHGLVLENIAALERDGAYLGAFSISRTTRESALFVDAAVHAHDDTPDHPSIVNGSIAAAVQGVFGDVHFTERTHGSELFINPLMALCFTFELEGLARRCLYLDRIENTHLIRQVHSEIARFRDELSHTRPPRRIPH